MKSVEQNYRIRPMTLQDIDSVAELETRTNTLPWSRNKIWESLDVGNDCWVCHGFEPDNELLAYAIVSTVLDEAGLLNICVDKDFQGRGLGRYVLNFLVKNLRQRGIATLHLEVRAGNVRAIGLYKSLGFKRTGLRKAYYPALDGREDAHVYSLVLSAS